MLQSFANNGQDLFFPGCEISINYSCAGFIDQPEEEAEVLNGSDLSSQNFFGMDKMPQVGFGMMLTSMSRHIGIDWAEIIFPSAVSDIDYTVGGIEEPMACISGREYTIEHINTEGNTFQDVLGCSNPHEVAWFAGW